MKKLLLSLFSAVVTKDVPAYALELSLRQSCKATGLDVPMWNPFGIQ